MDVTQAGIAALRQTELTLRKLAAQAIAEGEYASVAQVTSWARAISEMLNGETRETVGARSPSPAQGTNRMVRVAKAASRGKTAKPRAAATDKEYPRFFRRGEQLIRVSWSRGKRKEYQHKAPYSALRALATAVEEIGQDGRVFSTDDFLPIHDPSDSSPIPIYQAYVGIALLKQAGLIDQHGRQGYSVPRPEEFKESVELIWRKLPSE